MSFSLTIAGSDVSHVAAWDATIQVGRDGLDSQPDASVLDVSVRGWQPAGRLSDPVVLSDAIGVLFHGTVTDLKANLEPWNFPPWTVRLTAVGPLADVGRVVIGDEPWQQETDSQRIKRILNLALIPNAVNPNINGPRILPRDVDRKSALELAHEVAGDALGVLWEQPSDTVTSIRYTPQRLRAWQPVAPLWSELSESRMWSELPPAMTWDAWTTEYYGGELLGTHLELDARAVLADVELSQQIGDLIRKVRVQYGPEVEEGERTQAVVGSGTPELSLDSQLADLESANAVADSLWRARREPAWRMASATIPLSQLDLSAQETIRDALAVGTKLTLTNIGFDAPIGATWQGYIEGWAHELADESHMLILNLVDRRLIEPANRWQDLDAALMWQEIDAALQWEDVVGGF